MSNPILAFSARRRMRSVRTPLVITCYALLLAAIGCFLTYACYLRPTATLWDIEASVNGYVAILVLQFVLLVLVAPAMTAGSISGERERQTLDLLLVTNMGAARLVLGKLLESFGFLALLTLSSMPALSLAMLVGSATLPDVLAGVAFLLSMALMATSIGMFCSTLFQRTVTATVVSYLAVLGVGAVTLLPLIYDVSVLGAIYEAANVSTAYVATGTFVPVSFVLNPLLGFLALLQTQTGDMETLFWSFSYTLGNASEYMHFGAAYLYNMAFMVGSSVLLAALSALNLRLRSRGRVRRKRHA